ncbi:MAG: 17 kDa surface antigen [Verrucomicrobia bacterium]|nr:17 kDa surface antigen [Verrucomicrobiota bacterium]
MKSLLLSLTLAVAGVSSANAQNYYPASNQGAVLGGIVGALIGGHHNDRWVEGAAIGSVAGALLGAAVEQPYSRGVVYAQPQCAPAPRYASQPGCNDVVYVNRPAGRVVRYAQPAPRVVYVNRFAPCSPPRYVARPPVVVRGHRVIERRPQTIVYSHSRERRD